MGSGQSQSQVVNNPDRSADRPRAHHHHQRGLILFPAVPRAPKRVSTHQRKEGKIILTGPPRGGPEFIGTSGPKFNVTARLPGGRPPRKPGAERNGSKIAHWSSGISKLATANLRCRGQLRISPLRVGSSALFHGLSPGRRRDLFCYASAAS